VGTFCRRIPGGHRRDRSANSVPDEPGVGLKREGVVQMSELIEVASGLKFPEGPIAMPDGDVILVEMFGPRLTRVSPNGVKETVAEIAGGPNGAALGPEGLIYVCNNGGSYSRTEVEGLCFPGPVVMDKYIGGRIQTVNPGSGEIRDLYTHCEGTPLNSPNDLVFDAYGGFYFTDHGLVDRRILRMGGIYYAKADGSMIREIVFPVRDPNGIGLSPDGETLYWAETQTSRLMQRKILSPGVVNAPSPLDASACLYGFSGFHLLDSLGVDGAGNVCVATCINGGISAVSPKGDLVDFVATDDHATTNICFGGDHLTIAYITLSGTGRLVKTEWPRGGAKLEYLNL
jgi:gluconolactonase